MSVEVVLAKATPSIDARTPPAPTSMTLPLAALRMNWLRLTPCVTSVMQTPWLRNADPGLHAQYAAAGGADHRPANRGRSPIRASGDEPSPRAPAEIQQWKRMVRYLTYVDPITSAPRNEERASGSRSLISHPKEL